MNVCAESSFPLKYCHGRSDNLLDAKPSCAWVMLQCMPIHHLFQTPVYAAVLESASAAALNRRLLRESLQLRLDDRAGRAWSVRNYPAGYTSYNSRSRLQ